MRKKILYAEDDEDDREFLADAISEVNADIEVVLVENGVRALEYLQKINNNNQELPCLIVLDINMPFMDGRETLTKIKANNWLKHISTLIFTSSVNPNDKAFFNKLGIEMITKPSDPVTLKNIVTHMLEICA